MAETAAKLLTMAYEALEPDGLVVICDGFKEDFPGFSFAWEFRYLFLDELEAGSFKTFTEYKKILTRIGFTV